MTEVSIRFIAPLFHVSDVSRSIGFYERLGFTLGNSFTPPGAAEPSWASMTAGGSELMIANGSGGGVAGSAHKSFMLYVYCNDVEAKHAELEAEGVQVSEITRPFYNPAGEFKVTDPDGYSIYFS